MIRWSVQEIRRIAGKLAQRRIQPATIIAWSLWRRAHQAAARRAHAAGKPVVAYKLGRSALGERLARSHTGALAGSDAALEAYFRDCGILRVDMLETLIEIAPLVAGRVPARLSRPPRVAVVTTTGGGAASVVDRLGLARSETGAPGSHAASTELTMARSGALDGRSTAEVSSPARTVRSA